MSFALVSESQYQQIMILPTSLALFITWLSEISKMAQMYILFSLYLLLKTGYQIVNLFPLHVIISSQTELNMFMIRIQII